MVNLPSPSHLQHNTPRACYIHVPFCTHRCGYCDFTLIARRPDLVDDYLKALELEISALETPREVDTLFLGGGTPTFLSASQLSRLFDILKRWFPLASNYEWSIEANPTGLTDDKLEVMQSYGVNRVSLGVQTFDSELLKLLERDHDEAIAIDAVRRLLSRFSNVSIDLIFGIPGQSLSHWLHTIATAIQLGTQHISTYGLTFEAGTTFWSRLSKGQLQQIPDTLEREMYEAVMDRLPAAGYLQYEISNFARPGFESRHNQVYWNADSFYGFGPGAAAFVDGVRRTNHRSVTTWIKRTLAGQNAVGESETLDREGAAREAVMVGFRQCHGISQTHFKNRYGIDLPTLAGREFNKLIAQGLLEIANDHVRLTREGRCVANRVIVEFMG
ncbi:MAG: radical SAM family heme chaperone HemW [Planctomycetaceae bacterium]